LNKLAVALASRPTLSEWRVILADAPEAFAASAMFTVSAV
jgi:hypothetical protein